MTAVDTWTPARERQMPSLKVIIDYWADHPDLVTLFPHLEAHWIGWGEPFCFRCGWLAPVERWTDHRAGGWLERAHLQDHCLEGDDQPGNIVPLCIPCHDAMPGLLDRDTAIAWVATPHSEIPHPILWQTFTDTHARRSASSGRARVYRLKGQFLATLMGLDHARAVFPRDVVVGEAARSPRQAGQRDAS